MRIDKTIHAPGTVLLIEMGGTIHEAVIVGWSPMGQAVKMMLGQNQVWLHASKSHIIEFLKIMGWDEFEKMLKEMERENAEKAQEAEFQREHEIEKIHREVMNPKEYEAPAHAE